MGIWICRVIFEVVLRGDVGIAPYSCRKSVRSVEMIFAFQPKKRIVFDVIPNLFIFLVIPKNAVIKRTLPDRKSNLFRDKDFKRSNVL